MKKLSLFLAAAASFSLFAAPSVPGKVNVDDFLNVRQGPGLKYPVMGKVSAGSDLKILRICDAWIEAEAPDTLPVFISEARINADGKTNGEVNMRIRRDVAAPSYGVLPAGTAVKVLGERANGWVRIAPPAGLKIYVATICVKFDRDAFDEKGMPKNAQEPAAAPAADAAAAPAAAPAADGKETVQKEAAPAPVPVTLKGSLIRWKYSKSPKTAYALVESPKGKNIAFVTADENAPLLEAKEGKEVTVIGVSSEKTEAGIPIVRAISLEEASGK